MRLVKLALLLAVVPALVGGSLAYAAFNAAPTAEQILINAVQTLRAAQDGHAMVSVQYKTPDESGTATVEIWGKKTSGNTPSPYEFRAEVRQASDSDYQGGVYVSDGKQFWAYAPNQKTVWTGTVDQPQSGKENLLQATPEALVQQLLDVATASLAGTEAVQGHSAYKLQLVPQPGKAPQAALGTTGLVWIDSSRWVPLQASVNGGSVGQGQVTFIAMDLNVGVSNDRFQFQIPAGVKVVNADDLKPKHMTLSEATKTAGFSLQTPAYVPNGATLVDVFQQQHTFVLRYESSKGSFAVAQGTETRPSPKNITGQPVSLRGTTGTLYTDNTGSRVLLVWSEKGINYSVSGALSSADALKVAESLK